MCGADQASDPDPNCGVLTEVTAVMKQAAECPEWQRAAGREEGTRGVHPPQPQAKPARGSCAREQRKPGIPVGRLSVPLRERSRGAHTRGHRPPGASSLAAVAFPGCGHKQSSTATASSLGLCPSPRTLLGTACHPFTYSQFCATADTFLPEPEAGRPAAPRGVSGCWAVCCGSWFFLASTGLMNPFFQERVQL